MGSEYYQQVLEMAQCFRLSYIQLRDRALYQYVLMSQVQSNASFYPDYKLTAEANFPLGSLSKAPKVIAAYFKCK